MANEVHVVGMPQFVNPNSPETNSGSINFDLDKHPAEHAADYGGGYDNDPGGSMLVGDETPDSLDEMTKDQLKVLAEQYDLPISGNKDELIERIQTYEDGRASSEDN